MFLSPLSTGTWLMETAPSYASRLAGAYATACTGFYHQGIPVLPVWLSINRPMELSVCSSLLLHLTLVIHLCLQSMLAGGPVEMATQVLAPYIPYGGFWFVDLPFDIRIKASSLAAKLQTASFKNVMVALTNHSDNSHRDLFIGTNARKENQVILPSELVVTEDHCFLATIAFDVQCCQVMVTLNLILGVVEILIGNHGQPQLIISNAELELDCPIVINIEIGEILCKGYILFIDLEAIMTCEQGDGGLKAFLVMESVQGIEVDGPQMMCVEETNIVNIGDGMMEVEVKVYICLGMWITDEQVKRKATTFIMTSWLYDYSI
ncbi:hypothetical protein BKA83DRAFT_4123632 [Pisolithus microcarpus]|nr:hypothetical protein BKA83DRAFT_4123632 [Pisolithus microcarpus]